MGTREIVEGEISVVVNSYPNGVLLFGYILAEH